MPRSALLKAAVCSFGLAVTACGQLPAAERLATLSATSGSPVMMAEAGGSRGVWAGGSRGVWAGSYTASTTSSPNTFVENLPLWAQVRLPQGQALAPALGAGVTVAVIDTGLDVTHPAFTGRLSAPSGWRDFVDGDRLPQDEGAYGDDSLAGFGHGTNVGSIVLQVAPNATILPLRVLKPDGTGRVEDTVAAIDHAVAAGAQVINLSAGMRQSSAIDTAVARAAQAGVIVVASVGNSGDQRVTHPAWYARDPDVTGAMTLSVGSAALDDRKSGFSAYGVKLELLAPGEKVYGAAPQGLVEAWTGTSMAAPVVSGALALALGEAGAAAGSRAALLSTLTDSARNVDAAHDVSLTGRLGSGVVDVERFLTAALR